MPLIQVDLQKQNDKKRLRNILDTIHECAVEAFEIPEQDRYQIVVRVTSKQRTREKKEKLYSLLCERLNVNCGIPPKDLLVSITENSDADWSFGFGKAQFLTGDL